MKKRADEIEVGDEIKIGGVFNEVVVAGSYRGRVFHVSRHPDTRSRVNHTWEVDYELTTR